MWQVRTLGPDSTLHQKRNRAGGELIVPQSSWLGKTEDRERASSVPAGNKSAIYQHTEMCEIESINTQQLFLAFVQGALRSSCLGLCFLSRHHLLSESSCVFIQVLALRSVLYWVQLPLSGALMHCSLSSRRFRDLFLQRLTNAESTCSFSDNKHWPTPTDSHGVTKPHCRPGSFALPALSMQLNLWRSHL